MEDASVDATPGSTSRGQAVTVVKLVAAVPAVLAFVIFAWQNSASIEVEFLAFSFSVPLFVLMVLSALVGIAVWSSAASSVDDECLGPAHSSTPALPSLPPAERLSPTM